MCPPLSVPRCSESDHPPEYPSRGSLSSVPGSPSGARTSSDPLHAGSSLHGRPRAIRRNNITHYTVSQKNVPLCHCPYLRQILTNFRNSFTGTFCIKRAVTGLLNIPAHLNCVTTLSRVGFLPAETCFCRASGLNRQKLGLNRQKPDLNCQVFKHAHVYIRNKIYY